MYHVPYQAVGIRSWIYKKTSLILCLVKFDRIDNSRVETTYSHLSNTENLQSSLSFTASCFYTLQRFSLTASCLLKKLYVRHFTFSNSRCLNFSHVFHAFLYICAFSFITTLCLKKTPHFVTGHAHCTTSRAGNISFIRPICGRWTAPNSIRFTTGHGVSSSCEFLSRRCSTLTNRSSRH